MGELLALVVLAQVFTWTDAKGVVHYTNDPASIPRTARVKESTGGELSLMQSTPVAAPSPAPDASVAVGGIDSAEAVKASERLKEEAWRKRFREARARVERLEEDIEADRKRTEEVGGLPVNAQFNCQTGWWGPPVFVNGTSLSINGSAQVAPGVIVGGSVQSGSVGGIRQTTASYVPCTFGFNPEWQRVRERLESNRRELVRAKEDLDDLERHARYDAIPLHWRR